MRTHESDHTGSPDAASTAWIEVTVPLQAARDELTAMLDDADVTGAWEEHGEVKLYWPAARWSEARLDRVRAMVDRLGGDPRGVRVADVPATDWNATWAASVTPIRIGRRFIIRPSWRAVELRDGDLELIIDPKQAFGTGHHATTRMLMEWMEELIRGGERVVDVGTGSGILAMAALRLGAVSALCIDHDPVAIACAREAATMNGFGAELRFNVAALCELALEPADVVIANLDGNTIRAAVQPLAEAVALGGTLLLSGLLLEDARAVESTFGGRGARIAGRRESENWVALAVTR